MMKHTKILWLCLIVIAIFSIVSGCGSGGSSDKGAPVIVTVTDYSGIRIPHATVVLGDSNGAMRASGVTDEDGQITFKNAPANATVTAATTCLRSGTTITTYSIDVEYDVNGSVVLSLDNCTATSVILPPVNDSPLGTVTVNVTNTPGNVTQTQITVGRQIFSSLGGLITRQTITIRESDLDSNGAFSIMVTGMDAYYNTVAYGVLLDQTFTDGMTVDIPMGPMSFVQFQITNLPTTAVSLQPSVRIYGSEILRPGSRSTYTSYSLISAPSSTTMQVTYIPGIGNQVNYQIDVGLDQDHDGIADSHQGLSLNLSATTPSNQSFDLSKALPAPSVTVTGADTATPTLYWSGADPAATSIFVSARLHTSTADLYLSLSNLTRSRASIRYPELPDSLVAFRPNKVEYFSVYTSAFEGSVYKSSYGSYQAPNP